MKVVHVGVDEAGRGAVVGPMVIAFVALEADHLEELKALGVKDSKKLTPKKREEIFEVLSRRVDRYAKVLSAKEIDNRSVVAISLDEFELSKIAEGLYEFLSGLIREKYYKEPVEFRIYVDAPGAFSTESRKILAENFIVAKLSSLLKKYENVMIDVNVEPKADDKYIIVSAASIIAKVLRDRAIERLKKKIGEDFGSGYPSDPKTISFLERISKEERPEYVRSSRSTAKRIKKAKSSFLEDFLEDLDR